jgi:hypothetical protein
MANETTPKTPTERSVVGVITAIDHIQSDKGDVVLISIQDAEDNITTIGCGTAYWAKVGKLFALDTIAQATYEVRVAGVTGYVPKGKTEMVAHTSDSTNLTKINRFSAMSFQRKLNEMTKDADIAVIGSVEPERVNAVASYLAAYVGK